MGICVLKVVRLTHLKFSLARGVELGIVMVGIHLKCKKLS